MSLNIRQQKYKANRLAGMSQLNAARAAGYSENYAKVACRIDRSVKVSLADSFERAGFTDKALIKHALKGIASENPTIAHKYFETILKLTERLSDKPIIDQSQHKHITYVWGKDNSDSVQPAAVPGRDTQLAQAV